MSAQPRSSDAIEEGAGTGIVEQAFRLRLKNGGFVLFAASIRFPHSRTPGKSTAGGVSDDTRFEWRSSPLRNTAGLYSLPLKIAAITRGLRRPCMTATIQSGLLSGAQAMR